MTTTPHARILSLINAAWTTQAIAVACELRLPDLMAGGARNAKELASAAGAHVEALRRLLRALVTLDLCIEDSQGRFALSADGQWLRSDRADSLQAWARLSGTRIWDNWRDLERSVRTGQSARKRRETADDFGDLDRDAERADRFNAAMMNITRPVADSAAATIDWRATRKAVDVGGGAGELVASVLARHAHLRGVVFDLEHARAAACQRIKRDGLSGRCEFVAGDFFAAVPEGADAYLLKSVLHNWDDERAAAIVRNCARAAASNARVFLIERLLPDRLGASNADREAARSDLNMLVGCGGRERTEAEFRNLLRDSGLRLGETLPLAGGFSALSAVRAD